MRSPADDARLAAYSSFMVGPIEVRRAEGVKTDASDEDLRALADYFAESLRTEFSKHYEVAESPGPGVARFRAAITGAQTATPLLNVHPATRFTGAGAGSVIAECELVDSVTGEQIVAYVESRQGPRVGLEGTSRLGDAQAVLRGWAAQVRRRIDAAHGKTPDRGEEP